MLRLVPQDSPRAIAFARTGLGVACILFAVEMTALLLAIAHGDMPFPMLHAAPQATETLALTYFCVAVALGICIAIGFHTAFAAWVTIAMYGGLLLVDQQAYSHHGWLLSLLLVWLALAGPDRVRAVRRQRNATAVPWAQLLMMSQLSVCYFFAAVSKVNGDYLSGTQFDSWLRWDLGSEVHQAIAAGSILTELFLAIGLWIPRLRGVAVLAGLGLHGSIVVMMAQGTLPFLTFALMCLSLYPLYYGLPAPAARRVVVWDSDCSFCRRWVALFRRLDWFQVHRFVGSDEPEALDDPRLTREMAEEALQLLGPGRHAQGYDAVRRILAVCPPTLWTAPLLWLPPVTAVGDRVYRHVAARRSCSID